MPDDRLITLDFETYWDSEYSLSRMTTEAYIRDDRFEVIGVGVQHGNQAAEWYSGPDVADFLHQTDYRDKMVLCHNTLFDGAILSWCYDIRPKLWLDTLSMARPKWQSTSRLSLAALAGLFKLGVKGDEVLRTQGKRRADFSAADLQRLGTYCLGDVGLTHKLFNVLVQGFPARELLVIDQTLRMFTEPQFVLDRTVLAQHLFDEQARKQRLLDALGGDKMRAVLSSSAKLAALLKALGATVPMKTSPATGKPTFAFAKTDTAFTAMREHPNPAVRAVVEARLGTKSSIEETRTKSFLDIAARGPLPIALRYFGAHTGRFSGMEKVNLQNLPRGGALRRAVAAPKGHVVVSCDSSQIEARMIAWMAGQIDLLRAFAGGRDVYCEFATDVYGRKITKKDKTERHVGKSSILGLGYGMGAERFVDELATGFIPVNMELHRAKQVVDLYRNKYHAIASLWQRGNRTLAHMVTGGAGEFCPAVSYDTLGFILPNGMRIDYHLLHKRWTGYAYSRDRRAFQQVAHSDTPLVDTDDKLWTKLYGAKCCENLTQALARIVVADQMVAIGRHYPVALQVHDEVICVVPEAEAEACKALMLEVMSTTPDWAEGLPVACEAGIGANYGEAK